MLPGTILVFLGASDKCVSHGRASHGHASHRRASHRRKSHRHKSHRHTSLISMHLAGTYLKGLHLIPSLVVLHKLASLGYGNTNHRSGQFWGLCTSGISDTWESRATNDGDCENRFGFLA